MEEEHSSQHTVHIYEHLSPIRDKLSKLEATSEFHAREIVDLRSSTKRLEDKIEANHKEVLHKFDAVYDKMLKEIGKYQDELRIHMQSDEEHDARIFKVVSENKDIIRALEIRVYSVAGAFGLLFVIFETAKKLGFI